MDVHWLKGNKAGFCKLEIVVYFPPEAGPPMAEDIRI